MVKVFVVFFHTAQGRLEIRLKDRFVNPNISTRQPTKADDCKRLQKSQKAKDKNTELSYDDDGYDLADAYATPNTGISEKCANEGTNISNNQSDTDPVYTVENPYYGGSYAFTHKNGQAISKGSNEATTKNVLVHQNPYYDHS